MAAERAERSEYLHCRMRPEDMALMDSLVAHFDCDSRTNLVRVMLKDFRNRMEREKTKKAKEEGK